MSWTSKLYETYEYNIGIEGSENRKLVPMAHMYAKAQVEITIDVDGKFVSAKPVQKDEQDTLIPVTEKSQGARTSGITPHPLEDTLSYLAGDYLSFANIEKEKKEKEEKERKNLREKNDAYMKQLKRWADWNLAHIKVKSIYQYLTKESLISDLKDSCLVTLNDAGKLDNKKICGKDYKDVLVRFIVLNTGNLDGKAWTDQALIQNYIDYYHSIQNGKTDYCYISGKEETITVNHPTGVVSTNPRAKIISANDDKGFTFRGRFTQGKEALTVGYESSQKIHAALTWLVANQGSYAGIKDKRTFVCWNPKGKSTPDILSLFGMEEEKESSPGLSYKQKLSIILRGYVEKFDDSDEIVFMGLEAATPGRLSITYYSEHSAKEFMNRVSYWEDTFCWFYSGWNDDTKTPPFWQVICCAFGHEINDKKKAQEKRKNTSCLSEAKAENNKKLTVDDKIMREQQGRLVKCLVDKQIFPYDIVNALKIKASNLQAYSERNREYILSTACAAIVKYNIDRGLMKEEQKYMKLETENRDRSYLFGRLLAIYEKVERITYSQTEKDREPNAIRLQSAFVNHPMQGWKTLNDVVAPYFQMIKLGSREYYRNLIAEITTLFREEDAPFMNQGLKETYLLGYYLQRVELNRKKDNVQEENNTETEEES
ncbi:MAG: type I-C CRISPR-associated protein Cas8c/Csd1 [Lachnospiraceae bacterium]|nr:type I-C CRISPR-associated protein Cas8c/Csd1 [Lachnospiraceae bacterium]